MANYMQALGRFLAEKRRELRAEYPDATNDELRETIALERERWFMAVVQFERGDTIPAGVFKSYRHHVGQSEAARMFRWAGNFEKLAGLPERQP